MPIHLEISENLDSSRLRSEIFPFCSMSPYNGRFFLIQIDMHESGQALVFLWLSRCFFSNCTFIIWKSGKQDTSWLV